MALYQSEFTHFLQKLKTDRPGLEAEQRKGRAIWWDQAPLDLDRTRRNEQSRVAQKAYPYQAATEAELERRVETDGTEPA